MNLPQANFFIRLFTEKHQFIIAGKPLLWQYGDSIIRQNILPYVVQNMISKPCKWNFKVSKKRYRMHIKPILFGVNFSANGDFTNKISLIWQILFKLEVI